MKNLILKIVLILLLPVTVFSQTIIPGGNISGTWTIGNSPFTVQGNLTIVAGSTLIIEPGVEIIVQGNYRFLVKGVINAEGTAEAPISFSKHIPGPGWEGLRFENAYSGSQLSHCIFQYGNASGGFPDNVGGAIYITGNAPAIQHCVFRYNVASYGGAIFSIASSPVIEQCVFYGNASGNNGGAIILKGGNPKVYHCTFYDNSADGGGAIALEFCNAYIQNSIFFMNDGYGAIYPDQYSDDAQIKYCDFSQNLNGDVTGYKPTDFGIINNQNNNGDPSDIYFNIFLDPLFSNYGNEDFTLTASSPCRDAGNPILGNDPDGTLPDMGAFYFAAQPMQTIEIPEGWSGISSYMLPQNSDIEQVLAPIINELVIIYNDDGVFWPQGGLNSLEFWDPNKAYIIKTNAQTELSMDGSLNNNNTLLLNAGWNLLPVLTNCEVSTSTINNAIGESVVIIREIAGTKVFWPEAGVSTLEQLIPGKAYSIYVLDETSLEFPTCE